MRIFSIFLFESTLTFNDYPSQLFHLYPDISSFIVNLKKTPNMIGYHIGLKGIKKDSKEYYEELHAIGVYKCNNKIYQCDDNKIKPIDNAIKVDLPGFTWSLFKITGITIDDMTLINSYKQHVEPKHHKPDKDSESSSRKYLNNLAKIYTAINI
jgi:hypothetical protein